MTIQLLDVIAFYKGQQHQKEAIAYLQANIPKPVLDKFTEIWRSVKEEPKPPVQQPKINTQIQAFLKLIRVPEGTSSEDGYRIMFTGKRFSSFADHPRLLQCAGDLCSDAAGAYQFLSTTWDSLNLPDFSPENQDKGAIELIKRRGAYQNIIDGNIRTALDKCSWEWASLPPGRYGQPSISYAECDQLFLEFGGQLNG
jgi:muramidase (phage lysozyme)